MLGDDLPELVTKTASEDFKVETVEYAPPDYASKYKNITFCAFNGGASMLSRHRDAEPFEIKGCHVAAHHDRELRSRDRLTTGRIRRRWRGGRGRRPGRRR